MLIDISGHNFEEAAAVFSNNYGLPPMVVTPTRKKFWWRQTAIGDETMSLRKTWGFAQFDTFANGPGSDYVVASLETGQVVFETGRTSAAAPLHLPFITLNTEPVRKMTGIDIIESLVHIDQSYVRGVAQELRDTEFHDFHALIPATGRELVNWRRIANVVASVMVDSSEPESSLLRQEMSRLIAIAMLSSFPFRSTELPSRQTGVEPAGVKRAVDFIQENAHLPIGPTDIARAAGLSVRSLQYALRRYRETTPTALLQAARLHRVHADLSAADPHLETVTGIARGWGFVNLGRFSSNYRAQFGQLPNVTLRS